MNEKALEKITDLTILLQRLRQRFSQALRAWSRFSGDGDELYFADLRTHPVASQALSSIQQCFEKTCDLEERLAQLKEHCEGSTTIVRISNLQLLTFITDIAFAASTSHGP